MPLRATERLTSPERCSLLAALKLAANAPGFAPDGRLAVLTADGCAVAADKVAVDDAPWLLRRLRPGVVHVASYFELYSWPATTEPRSVLLFRIGPFSSGVNMAPKPPFLILIFGARSSALAFFFCMRA